MVGIAWFRRRCTLAIIAETFVTLCTSKLKVSKEEVQPCVLHTSTSSIIIGPRATLPTLPRRWESESSPRPLRLPKELPPPVDALRLQGRTGKRVSYSTLKTKYKTVLAHRYAGDKLKGLTKLRRGANEESRGARSLRSPTDYSGRP